VLQEFVLRDNKLLRIPSLSNFVNLNLLDVSFNKVTSMNGLSAVSSTLKELYLSKNEIPEIEEIEHLSKLRVLELGSNKIRVWTCLN
jgi:protein phosphatase 1 regulatory subunit 7